MDNTMIEIQKADGTIESVTLVTYLISNDGLSQYIIYTKNEVQGDAKDHVIYISKVLSNDGTLTLTDVSDVEWNDVLHLMKKIANAE